MTTLGIIHGVAEVLERSVMVIIDHFIDQLLGEVFALLDARD